MYINKTLSIISSNAYNLFNTTHLMIHVRWMHARIVSHQKGKRQSKPCLELFLGEINFTFNNFAMDLMLFGLFEKLRQTIFSLE